MKIENEFTVSTSIEKAWEILNDIPLIAPCMPGAMLTNSDGDTHEGKVKIKVGPVTSEYKGKAVFIEKDEAARKLVIKGEGRDTRGAGNANADITLTMKADGANTIVNVDTDLKITGKVAQFGRGVIVDISQKLLGQFVDCLEAKVSSIEEDAGKIAEAGAATAGAMGIGKPDSGDAAGSDGDVAPTDCWPDGSPADAAAGAAAAVAGGAASVADGAGAAVSGAADAAKGLVGGATGAVAGMGAGAAGVGAGAAAAAAGAAGALKGKAAAAGAGLSGGGSAEEPEALDLMDIAGGAVYKRLIPVAIVGLLIAALVIWLILR